MTLSWLSGTPDVHEDPIGSARITAASVRPRTKILPSTPCSEVPRVGCVRIPPGRPLRTRGLLAECPGGLELDGQLRSLEQPLQPAEDLGVGQGQLLEGPRSDLRGELVELPVQFVGKGFPELALDGVEDAP